MARKSVRTTVIALSAVAGAIGIAASIPAEATELRLPTALVLTVQHDGHAAKVRTLRCDPNGGSHPVAADACAALTGVNGDFEQLNAMPDRACTLHLDPVTVTARGTWRHRPVMFTETYGNPCVLMVTTGPVFATESDAK